MVNIIKAEIVIEGALESRLRVIYEFSHTTPTFINGAYIRLQKLTCLM